LAQREIRCGEAANFQGDERDVIVLTTVVALDPNSSSTRFSAMTGTAP
jgi:superfamily I DNA and/or RNA helicase